MPVPILEHEEARLRAQQVSYTRFAPHDAVMAACLENTERELGVIEAMRHLLAGLEASRQSVAHDLNVPRDQPVA